MEVSGGDGGRDARGKMPLRTRMGVTVAGKPNRGAFIGGVTLFDNGGGRCGISAADSEALAMPADPQRRFALEVAYG